MAAPRMSAGRAPWLVLAFGVLVTLLAAALVHLREQDRLQAEFERRADNRVAVIEHGLQQATAVLATVNRLFQVVPDASRAQFREFTAPLLAASPQLRALSYQRLVPGAQRAAYEAARQRTQPGFVIQEADGLRLHPAPARAQYRVLEYVAPERPQQPVRGLNVAARPEQEAAARRACASGAPVMSQQFPVLAGGPPQSGFVILMPLYRSGTARPDCGAVVGYTAAVVRSRELVVAALRAAHLLGQSEFHIRVYATGAPVAAALAAELGPPASPAHSAFGGRLDDRPDPLRRRFTVAGAPWYVEVASTPHPLLEAHLATLLTLAGGMVLALVAAAYARTLAARARRVQRLVEERTQALRAANRSLQLRERAIEACTNGIVIASAHGPDYPIEYVNPAFERLTGYRAWEVVGRSPRLLFGGRRSAALRELAAIAAAQRPGRVTVCGRRQDGRELWADLHLAPFRDERGAINHFVVAFDDIGPARRQRAELEYHATHDALTGLANRLRLRERLQQTLDAAARGQRAVWVLFLDLDRFKYINDTLGHRIGDRVLALVAERLRGAVRAADTVARLGGDEFVVVLAEDGRGPLSVAAVRRLLDAVGQPATIEGHECEVGGSAGIALWPQDADDPDSLLARADLALQRAKQERRGGWLFYTAAMNHAVQARLRMERALRGALERGELELLYQPQADLRSGAVCGAQLRLRWNSPELGQLEAADFLAVAEDSGLFAPLCDWVLASACAQAQAWDEAGLGAVRIGLTLRARQFGDPALAGAVAAVLEHSGLAPGQLALGWDENVLMADSARSLEVLDRLRRVGVQLFIDDFGAGFSSLAQLKQLPVTLVRVAPGFVASVAESSENAAATSAVISLAHNLGIRVLAAGAASEADCQFLAQQLCDEVQGPCLAEPMAAAAFEAWLATRPQLAPHLRHATAPERTLLLVDDEPNILAALKRRLRADGYRILTAASGPAGLAVLAREPVDVILSDQRMPDMTGVEFLRTVKTLYPDTVRMVLSGFTELQSVTDAVNEGAIYKFLTKPWDDTQLRAHVSEAFAHKEMSDENRRLGREVRSANFSLAAANRQLEQLLRQQRDQIRQDAITLDIVREALQHVPLPIVGLDEDELVAFANGAACRLLGDGAVLGHPAAELMPEVLAALRAAGDGAECPARLDGAPVRVMAHSMGRATRARGRLITFLAGAAEEDAQHG